MKILITILIVLLWCSLGNCDLIVKGNRTVYTGEGFQKLTEGPEAPVNPTENDMWRDTSDNTLYYFDDSEWVVKRTTQDIKDEIQVFKNNIAGVNDIEARRCLKALGKILLKLYKESSE